MWEGFWQKLAREVKGFVWGVVVIFQMGFVYVLRTELGGL